MTARSAARAVRRGTRALIARMRFVEQFRRFRMESADIQQALPVRWSDRYPCLHDQTSQTEFDRHYVYHTAWAARVLAASRPSAHVDIGSDLRFVTIVSAFVPVRFFDYRPAPLSLSGLSTGKADLLSLPFPGGSIQSLSCMHVVEHIGLGRYGDPLDVAGDAKAAKELIRVLASGGQLLFVIPVGRSRVAFNAHRVYSFQQVLAMLSPLRLDEFLLIPDDPRDGDLVARPSERLLERQEYGCGCFRMVKP